MLAAHNVCLRRDLAPGDTRRSSLSELRLRQRRLRDDAVWRSAGDGGKLQPKQLNEVDAAWKGERPRTSGILGRCGASFRSVVESSSVEVHPPPTLRRRETRGCGEGLLHCAGRVLNRGTPRERNGIALVDRGGHF